MLFFGVAVGLVTFLAVAMAFVSPVREGLVGEHGSSLQTVAQVVPATVVAIFVFALGAVFVIAQIVIPSRGSRAISVLLRFRRIRLVVAGGLALLIGSLLIATNTPPWRTALAAALLLATGLYVPAATGLIASSLVVQTSPRSFMEQLITPPRRSGIVRAPQNGKAKEWRAEDLYQALRIFRGWIRTVNRIGESRDLHLALTGLDGLVQDYAAQVREELKAGGESALQKGSPDLGMSQQSTVSRIPDDFCGHLGPESVTLASGTSQRSLDPRRPAVPLDLGSPVPHRGGHRAAGHTCRGGPRAAVSHVPCSCGVRRPVWDSRRRNERHACEMSVTLSGWALWAAVRRLAGDDHVN